MEGIAAGEALVAQIFGGGGRVVAEASYTYSPRDNAAGSASNTMFAAGTRLSAKAVKVGDTVLMHYSVADHVELLEIKVGEYINSDVAAATDFDRLFTLRLPKLYEAHAAAMGRLAAKGVPKKQEVEAVEGAQGAAAAAAAAETRWLQGWLPGVGAAAAAAARPQPNVHDPFGFSEDPLFGGGGRRGGASFYPGYTPQPGAAGGAAGLRPRFDPIFPGQEDPFANAGAGGGAAPSGGPDPDHLHPPKFEGMFG